MIRDPDPVVLDMFPQTGDPLSQGGGAGGVAVHQHCYCSDRVSISSKNSQGSELTLFTHYKRVFLLRLFHLN